jgi:hypothetical protein
LVDRPDSQEVEQNLNLDKGYDNPALWSRPHESAKLSPDTELSILRGGGSDDPQRRL